MSEIPLYTRRQLPPGQVGTQKAPYSLAEQPDNSSGMIKFGEDLAGFSGKIFDKLLETRANNEHAEFQGIVSKAQTEFDSYVQSNPGASLGDIQKQKQKMLTDIDAAGNNSQTNIAKEANKNWILGNRGLLEAKSDSVVASVMSKQEQQRSQLIIDNAVAKGGKEGRQVVSDILKKQSETGLISKETLPLLEQHYALAMAAQDTRNEVGALKTAYTTGDTSLLTPDEVSKGVTTMDKAREIAQASTLNEQDKQSMLANIDSYEKQMKDRADVKTYENQTKTALDLADKLDARTSDADEIRSSNLDEESKVRKINGVKSFSQGEFLTWNKNSYVTPPTSTSQETSNAITQTILDHSLGLISTEEGMRTVLNARYGKNPTISEKDYQATRERFKNPYSTDLAKKLNNAMVEKKDEIYKAENSWYYTAAEKKRVESKSTIANSQLLDWVDAELKNNPKKTFSPEELLKMKDLTEASIYIPPDVPDNQKNIKEVKTESYVDVYSNGVKIGKVPSSKIEAYLKKHPESSRK